MSVVRFPSAGRNCQPQPASIDPIINKMLAQGGEQEARAEFWLARQKMAVAFSKWVYTSNDVDEIGYEHGCTDTLVQKIVSLWLNVQEAKR